MKIIVRNSTLGSVDYMSVWLVALLLVLNANCSVCHAKFYLTQSSLLGIVAN
jgi:hypothetical protein